MIFPVGHALLSPWQISFVLKQSFSFNYLIFSNDKVHPTTACNCEVENVDFVIAFDVRASYLIRRKSLFFCFKKKNLKSDRKVYCFVLDKFESTKTKSGLAHYYVRWLSQGNLYSDEPLLRYLILRGFPIIYKLAFCIPQRTKIVAESAFIDMHRSAELLEIFELVNGY